MIVVGILVPAAAGGAAVNSVPASSGAVIEIARRAATTGARTEIVGVAPAGPVGDRQLVQLASASVGHATVTRSEASGIEPADLDLALRYLPDVRAIVLVTPSAPLLATALAASSWSGATLLVVGPLDADAVAAIDAGGAGITGSVLAGTAGSVAAGPGASGAPAAHPGVVLAAPIVLDPPARDPDYAFAGVVAALAVRLDAGEDPGRAWATTVTSLAIDRK